VLVVKVFATWQIEEANFDGQQCLSPHILIPSKQVNERSFNDRDAPRSLVPEGMEKAGRYEEDLSLGEVDEVPRLT
jgi:hypothetical protein